ncbi:unnamed protein product [Brachionus calyciflorus]|uniref:Tubby C-terminal domain-containing protein n=1 Tax=Brachionus calyciflorus TaxID=104777 RepID=A0A813MAF0_9BILA|nr:unnamed protein product [Brachionus calyciflorus]
MSELLNNSVVSGRNLVYTNETNRFGDLDRGYLGTGDAQFMGYHTSSDEEEDRANVTRNESFVIKKTDKKSKGAISKNVDKNNNNNKTKLSMTSFKHDESKFKLKSVTLDHSKDYSSDEEQEEINNHHMDLNVTKENLNSTFMNKSYQTDLNMTTTQSNKILVAPLDDESPLVPVKLNEMNPNDKIDLSIFDLLDKTSKKFILQPATIGLNLKCQIFRQKGIYPEYKFYIENLDGNLLLLMTARKKKKTKTPCYLINYISFDLDDLEKYIETPLAKLKSNLLGTQFKMYDFGIKPLNDIQGETNNNFLKTSQNEFDYSETTSEDVNNSDQNFARREYLSIVYGFNVLGLKGPRHMSVITPGMDDKFNRDEFILKYKSDSLLSSWKKIEENLRYNSPNHKSSNSKIQAIRKSIFQLNIKKNFHDKKEGLKEDSEEKNSEFNSSQASNSTANNFTKNKTEYRNVIKLINKSPQWHRELNSFALNFNGRVTISSVKNYQIIHEVNPDYIVTQFGKVNKDLYTCDYSYPLCALQAFGIALTSLDNKIGCD